MRFICIGVLILGCASAPPVRECPQTPPPAAPEPPAERVVQSGDALRVEVGECELEWIPEGLVTDVSDEETAALAAMMREWLRETPGQRPLIEHRRGVLFAKSEDDQGADPPYPASESAQSRRACGLDAIWLRDHLRARYAMHAPPDMGGLTCDENVCCYAGMEFVSDGALVFRRVTLGEAETWALTASIEVAEAAIGPESVANNRQSVATALERLTESACEGEPPGFR